MIPVVLDFETFFSDDYRLKRGSSDKVGLRVSEYVLHPQFKVWGCAVRVGKSSPHWLTAEQLRTLLNRLRGVRTMLIGQNLKFDGFILSQHFDFVPTLYVDTLGMARAVIGRRLESHGLDALSQYIGRTGKVEGGAALEAVRGIRDLTVQQFNHLGVYAVGDIDETEAVFKWLAARFPREEYIILDQTIRAFCVPHLRMDRPMLADALVELEAKREALAPSLGYTPSDFRSKDKLAAILRSHGAEPPIKVSPSWHKKTAQAKTEAMRKYNEKLLAVTEAGGEPPMPPNQTYAFSKRDRAFVELGQRMNSPFVQKLVEARLTYASNLEVTRQRSYLDVIDASARRTGETWWPVDLNFSGAMNTHRLSGGEGGGGNPQNLGKKSPIRKAIKAKGGNLLIVADLSGIELRTCAALAGDQKTLQQVRDNDRDPANHPDPYCLFSTDLYGKPVRKPRDTDTPEMKSFYGDARTVGKISKLSLQYGVGYVTAVNTLWTWGVNIDEEFGQYMVKFYRESHREIGGLWKTCEQFLLPSIAQGGGHRLPTCPLIETFPDGMGIAGMLPIWYPDLRLDEVYDERWGKMKQQWSYLSMRKDAPGGRDFLYGGKVTENLSQYTAWKVMTYHWREIKRQLGLDMLLNVHDELVFSAPASEAHALADEVLRIMRIPPPWWPDLPVNAEVEVAERYGDAK